MILCLKRSIYIILFLLSISCQILAHQGGIKGSISDSLTGQKITSVIISLQENKQITSTDLLGNFYLPDIHAGTYTLKLSCLGYAPRELQVVVKEGETTTLSVSLLLAGLNLEEVLISQNNDPGSSMQTLSKIDIGLRPVKSSQDILRMIPGLVTAQHAGGGKAEQIFLRGFDIDHGTDIRLSVDGMPVNMVSHAHGQGYADLHFLTPETIDYVDFNKGPYYASQGDFTTAGYANFNTKNVLDKSSLKMEGGLFDSYRMVGLFDLSSKAMKTKNQSAYISSEYMYTNGYFKSPQNFNRINLMGKYHGIISDDKILTLSISTFSSKWDASGQIPTRAVEQGLISRFGSIDDQEGGKTSRTNANVILSKFLPNGGMIKNQLFLVNYKFELYSNFTFFLEDSVNGDQIKQAEQRNIYGYTGSYLKANSLFGKKLKSEIGIQLRYDDIRNSELSHTSQRKYILNRLAYGQTNELNAGAYVDETIYLTDQLILNAGIRIDQYRFDYVNELETNYQRKVVQDYIVSPKLNLFYNCTKNLQLYLKTGTGFHSNDARVVVADSVAQTLPRAIGGDLGVFIKPTKRLLVNLAVWTLDLEQEFVYVGDAAVIEPSGYTRRYGADFSARYQILSWLFVDMDANYAIPRTRGAEAGQDYVPLAPTITSIGGLTTKFKNGLNASIRYRHVGDRPANEDNSVTAKGYTMFDAVINYTKEKYALGITMENLSNAEWNEAQFDTESKLPTETHSVKELHYTPGTPFFIKGSLTFFF